MTRRCVPHEDVLQRALRLRLAPYRGQALEIETYDLDAAAFRDGIDLLLRLFGARRPVWRDRSGRTEPGRPVLAAGLRIARELARDLPRGWLRHQRRVRELARTVNREVRPPGDRVLFLRTDHAFDLQAGGSVGHLAGVIGALRELGRHVEVVSSDRLPGVPEDGAFHLVPPVYEPVRNLPELPMLYHNRQLLEYVETHWEAWAPDIVYQRYSLDNWAGPALRACHGVPYVCEYNGPLVWVQKHWGGRGPWFPKLALAVEELNLQAADVVVVVSDVLAEDVAARGVPERRVVVAPNGVDTEAYRPDIDGDAVRERYGLGDAPLVGFIGTFGPWHGAEALAETAVRIEARARAGDEAAAAIRFLMIGDGIRMDAVREILNAGGADHRVTLTGLVPQEQGPEHLAACDVLASPHVPNPDGSRFFGSPTKLFEYMAMGRAIVASELEQIGEVLDHGETAWLVPPGDPDALAGAILRLTEDGALRARLADNARRRAEAEHTWRAHTEKILAGLERVVGGEARA